MSGADPHVRTAAFLMGKPESAVSGLERQLAKAVNFGLMYGMSAEGLKAYAESGFGVEMSLGQARRFRNRYFQAYRGVARWQRGQERMGGRTRAVRTASGRLRLWAADRIPLPELLNTLNQGTGADILKRAMAELRPHLHGFGTELVASVHDELVVEVPEGKAGAMADVLERVMVAAGEAFIGPVPVVVETKVVAHWAGL